MPAVSGGSWKVGSGEWGSKGEGAAWALQQDGALGIVHDAENARRGKRVLDRERALAFLRLVEERMGFARVMSE